MTSSTLPSVVRFWRNEPRVSSHRDAFVAYGNANQTGTSA